MRNQRLWLVATLLTMAACTATPSPTSPPTATSRFSTVQPPAQRPTLPATWTPTATHTPITPSPTRTPTITPTPPDTPTADELCEAFSVETGLRDGRVFLDTDIIPMIITSVSREAPVNFFAQHRESGVNRGLMMPGGQINLVEFALTLLPRPGLYDWRLYINSPVYGEICEQSGYFFYVRSSDTPAE